MTGPRLPAIARTLVALAVFAALGAASLASARGLQFLYAMPSLEEYLDHRGAEVAVIPAGALSFNGADFRCGRFPAVMDAKLDDYGAAYFGFILLNPVRFEALPLPLKRYAYTHECGHQYVGFDEGEADCYAIRRGKREGWLDDKVLGDICGFISQSRGDGIHAQGARRCEMMRRCFARARTGREPL